MKKIFSLCLMAVFCMAYVACSDDNDIPTSEQTFVFKTTLQVTSIDEDENAKAAAEDFVKEVLAAEGLSDEAFGCPLTGKDSASVQKILTEKMQRVERNIAAAPITIVGTIEVKGVEQRYLGEQESKLHPITTWYECHLGLQDSSHNSSFNYEPLCEGGIFWPSKHAYHWVKSMRTSSKKEEGDTYETLPLDLNKSAGGEDVYLIFEHYGKKGIDTPLNVCPEKPITNVIAVYAPSAQTPATLVVDGYTYTKQNGVYDLTRGTGGSTYIYLYTTYDNYRDQYGMVEYLTTGGYDFNSICAYYDNGWFSHDDFKAGDNLPDAHYNYGRFINYRVVQAYNLQGQHLGELDCNDHAGGCYIKLVMAYTFYKS